MSQTAKLPGTMTAVGIRQPGGPEVLEVILRPIPSPGPGEVLIATRFAGINRPDLLQRKGGYPPPPGASDLPGLEVAGVIAALGSDVKKWRLGDQVCALVPGGGYAQFTLADADHCLPVPQGLSLLEASSLPETTFTVWANVVESGRLQRGETILVHGGSGGIGSTAIQLAKQLGATVIATAGSSEKVRYCEKIGADVAINYHLEAFDEIVKRATKGRGVDVILDIIGAPYLEKNLRSLAQGGRLVVIGLQGGHQGDIDLRLVLARHLTITASTLRPRTKSEKARLALAIEESVWPLFASGALRTHVDKVFPLENAADAHRYLESGEHLGKVVLAVTTE